MSNNQHNLEQLLAGAVFSIPDYQRGYAWDDKQVKEFIDDIDDLSDDANIRVHYMGTIVTYSSGGFKHYKKTKVPVKDVVDGQQRLTSVLLYMAVLLHSLLKNEPNDLDYATAQTTFLYSGDVPKLSLNGSDCEFYLSLLREGGMLTGDVVATDTPQRKRLARASEMFRERIDDCNLEKKKSLFDALTSRLVFSSYEIAEESEIGMTFELMNSRGKDLTTLELLKNYLMFWASRNIGEDEKRKALVQSVNRGWGEVYRSLGCSAKCSDDQCLRTAWILSFTSEPKRWKQYRGFKEDDCIPIRNFERRSKKTTLAFIESFVRELVRVARCYAAVVSLPATMPPRVQSAIQDVHHTGNVANTIPLLVALEMKREEKRLSEDEELSILRAVEVYSFRTFLWARRRSDAGKAKLFGLAKAFHDGQKTPEQIRMEICSLTEGYSPASKFRDEIMAPMNWYERYSLLRCVLFGYEQHLVSSQRPIERPDITWEDTKDRERTVEHILPQTPAEGSHWREVWSSEQIKTYTHDIGNLVLTRDNSCYKNFEFLRKKLGEGNDGVNPVNTCVHCYTNSLIAQEREIARENDWTPETEGERRKTLIDWILEMWCPDVGPIESPMNLNEEDDEDSSNEEGIR